MSNQTDNNSYDFIPVTAADAAEAESVAADIRDSESKYLKLVEGDTVIRFIPLARGMQGYGPTGREAYAVRHVHYVKRGGKDPKMVRVVCTRLSAAAGVKEQCPACAFIREMERQGVVFDEDPSAKAEVLYNVIVRGREHLGPMILKVGMQLHLDLQGLVKRAPAVYDPRASGIDVIINRKGQMRDTRYMVTYDMSGTRELGNPDWLKTQHDLSVECRQDVATSQLTAQLHELGLGSRAANVRPPPAHAQVTSRALPQGAYGSTGNAQPAVPATPAAASSRAPQAQRGMTAQDAAEGDFDLG